MFIELHCLTFAVKTGKSSECGACQTRDPPFQPLLSIADLSNVKTIVKNKVQRVEFIYLRPAISDFANCGPHLDRQDKEAGRNEVTCCSSRICPQISLKSLTTLTPLS